ncbi:MAG TPA: ABC transporter permease [Capillimicrobium sp.]
MAVAQVAVAVGLALAAIALSAAARLGLERDIAVVAVRAIVQLTVVGLVVTLVFEHVSLAAAFVAVMLAAAALTSAHRLAGLPRARAVALASIGLPALAALGVLLAAGAFPTTPRGVIPVAGILIGGAMAAVSLGGRRLGDALRDGLEEIETRLALGAPAREALRPTVRSAVSTALVPVLDQTRTVGLVTLPGTFVGLVLGGASPAEAARVQLTVLLALIFVELAAALLLARLVTVAWRAPGERVREPVG